MVVRINGVYGSAVGDVVVLEVVSVESVEPVFRADPDESGLILGNAVDRSRRESVGRSVVGDMG